MRKRDVLYRTTSDNQCIVSKTANVWRPKLLRESGTKHMWVHGKTEKSSWRRTLCWWWVDDHKLWGCYYKRLAHSPKLSKTCLWKFFSERDFKKFLCRKCKYTTYTKLSGNLGRPLQQIGRIGKFLLQTCSRLNNFQQETFWKLISEIIHLIPWKNCWKAYFGKKLLQSVQEYK